MHELSITYSIVDLVAETAKGRKVHRVTVEIGELSGVVSNSIAFWFPEVARGTELAEASLEIREVTALARSARPAQPNSHSLHADRLSAVRLVPVRKAERGRAEHQIDRT